MIDLCLMFFTFEMAGYKRELKDPTKTDGYFKLQIVLTTIAVLVDISKTYTDVEHLNGYKLKPHDEVHYALV
jgi:hypothetical protein